MSHIAYQPAGPTLETEADYVVVGSGAGGATAAVSLARGGASVAVVEAGPWRRPEDYPHSVYGAMRDMMDNWGTLLARGRAFWPIVQAKVVGGTTVINSAIVVRTPGDIFKEWERDHGVGGEAMARRLWGYQDQIEDELFIADTPPEAWGRSNELANQADAALGMDGHVIRRNVRGCVGSGQCLQGCRAGAKQSTNLQYIPEVLDLGGQLLSCAPVEKVEFASNRAVGVMGTFVHPRTRRKGGRFRVRARKAVIMAASVTWSPVLLARSGLKLPALGEYFRSHPGTGVFGVYDDPVLMNTGATQGWASVKFRESPGFKLETLALPLELVSSRLAGGGQQLMERVREFGHLAHWVMAVRAEAVGRVKPGLFGGPPAVTYGFGRPDMERMRQGMHTVARMHFAAGARECITGVYGMPFKIGPDEVDRILDASLDPRHWTAILSHLFGGCVMGADPTRSVCNERGEVHGTRGLVIADASQIPTTLGVNPQHTIMALARLRAHQLLEA